MRDDAGAIDKRKVCAAMPRIDEMRGLAALLVVIFHAIGGDPTVASSFVGHLTQSLTFVRMPLFIAISGYLYGLQRSRRQLSFAGLLRRARRVLPPFVLVTVVCCAISAAGGAEFDLVTGLLFGAWHMWYLQALLVITLLVTLIETFVRPAAWQLPIWAIGSALLVSTRIFEGFALFSVSKAMYLFPHFFAGAAFGALPRLLESVKLRIIIIAIGVIAFAFNEAALAGQMPLWTRTSLIAAIIGFTSFVMLATTLAKNTYLRRIGAYSLPIFLWHLPLFAVLSFVVLNPMDIEGYLAVVTKVTIGIVAPVLLSMITMRLTPALIVFIGQRSASGAATTRGIALARMPQVDPIALHQPA